MRSSILPRPLDSLTAGTGIRREKFVRPLKVTWPCFRGKTSTFRNSSATANGWASKWKKKSIWLGVTNETTIDVRSVQTVGRQRWRRGDWETRRWKTETIVSVSHSLCLLACIFTRPASLAAQPQTRLFKLFLNLWIVSFGSSGWYVSLL